MEIGLRLARNDRVETTNDGYHDRRLVSDWRFKSDSTGWKDDRQLATGTALPCRWKAGWNGAASFRAHPSRRRNKLSAIAGLDSVRRQGPFLANYPIQWSESNSQDQLERNHCFFLSWTHLMATLAGTQAEPNAVISMIATQQSTLCVFLCACACGCVGVRVCVCVCHAVNSWKEVNGSKSSNNQLVERGRWNAKSISEWIQMNKRQWEWVDELGPAAIEPTPWKRGDKYSGW